MGTDEEGSIRRARKAAAAAATTAAGDAERVLTKLQVRQQDFFPGETDLRCTFFFFFFSLNLRREEHAKKKELINDRKG